MGRYLSVFPEGQHRKSGASGIALAASSIAAVVFQIPAGLLIAGAGLMVSPGCLPIVLSPRF